jgi:MFS family permease
LQAYVSCALGISQIGYVMICFGVVNAICSVIFGSLMKYIGRFSIIVFGTVVHMGIFSYLLFWRPHPDSPLIFFIISGLWGVGDAVWQTQINGEKFLGLLAIEKLIKILSQVCTELSSDATKRLLFRTTDCGNLSALSSLTLTRLHFVRE